LRYHEGMRCPCGKYTVATWPTDHVCSDGTGTVTYTFHVEETTGSLELARALRASYQARPEPRDREHRQRWLEEHARKYAGRRP